MPTFRHRADISAIPESQLLGTCCTDKEGTADPNLLGEDVQKSLGDEAIEPVEQLLSELRAIERWDTEYWRKPRPEWHDKGAFVSRQKRRREIIRHLLSDIYQGEP